LPAKGYGDLLSPVNVGIDQIPDFDVVVGTVVILPGLGKTFGPSIESDRADIAVAQGGVMGTHDDDHEVIIGIDAM